MSPVPDEHHFDVRFLETLYVDSFGVLARITASRHEISESDAEQIVQEVLLSALRHLPKMPEPRVWLIAAVTAAVSSRARSTHDA